MPEPAAKKQKKASFEVGQAVMYYSKSNEEWLEDKVEAVNKDGTLQLDQKEEANPDLCVPTEGFDAENPPDVSKALQEEADAEDDEEDLGDEDSEDEDDYDEDDEDEEEDEGGFEVFEDEDDAGVGALKLYIKDSKKPLHEEPLYAGLVKKQKVEADPDSTAESSSVTVVFSVGPKEVQLTLDASAVVAGSTDSDVGVMYGEKELWTYSNATKDDEEESAEGTANADVAAEVKAAAGFSDGVPLKVFAVALSYQMIEAAAAAQAAAVLQFGMKPAAIYQLLMIEGNGFGEEGFEDVD